MVRQREFDVDQALEDAMHIFGVKAMRQRP